MKLTFPRLGPQAFNIGAVIVAILALVASLALHPGEDPRWVYLPDGSVFGETCAFWKATGVPCPQCGMTRSFVYAVRGHLVQAFLFNPAGLGLFVWIEAGGIVGLVRLVTRRPEAFSPPWAWLVGWAAFWILGLYAVPFLLRTQGINPLP